MNPTLGLGFKHSLLLECPICLEEYNETDRVPMIICTGQHCFCLKCTNQIIFRGNTTGTCPECRRNVQKDYLIKFRLLNQIKTAAMELKTKGSYIRKAIEGENQLKEQLRIQRQKNQWLLTQINQKESVLATLKQKSEGQLLEIDRLHKRIEEIEGKDPKNLHINPKVSLYSIYELSQKNREKYDIEDAVIQYIGENNKWYHLIINQQIPYNTPYSIKMKILKTQFRWCLLGVLDYDSQKNEQNTYNSAKAINYYAEGYKYPGPLKEGKGFYEGQTVQVAVNLKQSSIKWIVNGQIRASYKHRLLGDKNARLFPYLEMASTGDKIEIV